jgi:hypothetical protein
MKNIISLGAGVQSSTMALMAAAGEITPMPDAAIFADTQAEPQSVYRWLDWLESQLPYPVIRATHGNLAVDNLERRVSKKSGNRYVRTLIPTFILNANGTRGILPRKCTRDYKISVIQREVRRLLGIRAFRQDMPVLATSWIGISTDEAIRMKPSLIPQIKNRHPLIELDISRKDCLTWMEKHGYPKPPRSACVFCPYHSDTEWLRLKNEEPVEFQRAVEWERNFTEAVTSHDQVAKGVPFLHDSLVPLDQVKFNPESTKADQFGNECEGMCGV